MIAVGIYVGSEKQCQCEDNICLIRKASYSSSSVGGRNASWLCDWYTRVISKVIDQKTIYDVTASF